MKIAIFSDNYLPTKNGLVTMLIQLSQSLVSQNHEVWLFFPEVPNSQVVDSQNLHFVPLKSSSSALGGEFRLIRGDYQKAKKVLKDQHIQIIHTHTEGVAGWFGKKLAKELKLPQVHTFHTMWEEYNHYFLLPKFAIRKYLQKFLKGVSNITTPSQKTANYLNNIGIYNSVVIPNFLQPQNTTQSYNTVEELKLRSEDFVMLYVGRIAKEKRVMKLLKDLDPILAKYRHAKLLLVGGGPLENQVHKYIQNYQFQKQIITTGFVPWQNIKSYYKLANLYVNASISETLSTTALEALFNNLPMITYQDDGFGGIVINNQTGFMVKDGQEFAEKVDYLYQNRHEITHLQEGCKKIQQNFVSDRIIQIWENYYQKLV